MELSKTAARHIIRDDWEFGIKPQFRKNCASKAFTVRVPSEVSFKSAVGVKNGRMHFSGYYYRGAHQDNVKRWSADFEDFLQLGYPTHL